MSTKPFDFDAFIAGIKPSERKIVVYPVDNRSEIALLEQQIDAESQVESSSARFGSKPRSVTLAQKVKKLREEMEKSALTFTFAPLHPDRVAHYVGGAEVDRVAEGEGAVSAEDAMREAKYEQLAEQSVEPKLTKDQWKIVAERLGAPRFADLVNGATEHTLMSVTLPPFSPSTLDALTPKDSDES